MVALPLCILALAAGVYLLIKVNREYLGGIFKFFAWLIIILSLLALCGVVRHHHLRRMHYMHHMRGHWGMQDMRGGDGHCGMHDGAMGSCCKMGGDSACPMMGGKMMGDSVTIDRATCEQMWGKDACEKMCQGKDKCTISKDECARMCGATPACCGPANANACCKKDDKTCCKPGGPEMKSCCKKK